MTITHPNPAPPSFVAEIDPPLLRNNRHVVTDATATRSAVEVEQSAVVLEQRFPAAGGSTVGMVIGMNADDDTPPRLELSGPERWFAQLLDRVDVRLGRTPRVSQKPSQIVSTSGRVSQVNDVSERRHG